MSELLLFENFPFKPSLLTGLKLWLDAAETRTIVESGGDVSQWNEKSGNGNNATQGTVLDQPITNANTLNGKNVVDFNGTSSWMEANSVASSITGAHTIFIVASPNNISVTGRMTALQKDGDAAKDQSMIEIKTDGSLQLTSQFATVFDTNDWQNTPFYLSMVRGATVTTARINGSDTTTPSWNDNVPTDLNEFSIGQEFDTTTPSNFFNGSIGDILIYDRVLSTVEVEFMERYLANKWGLP